MRVLVSGGAGYIGSHTVVQLVAAGHEVVIVDSFANAKPTVINRLEALTGTHLPVHGFDLRDEDKTQHLFAHEKIDAVIHFAGLKAVGESVEKPLEYYENNLGATFSLVRAMRRHHVDKLVFSSSATVYGANAPVPMREEMPTSATNPYGWTKVMIEQVLRDVAAAEPHWRIALLRYFNPVGAHPSGTIGEDPQGIPNNLMPFIAQVAVGKLEKLRVFGDDYDTPDGTAVRDYIHVEDKELSQSNEYLPDSGRVFVDQYGNAYMPFLITGPAHDHSDAEQHSILYNFNGPCYRTAESAPGDDIGNNNQDDDAEHNATDDGKDISDFFNSLI
jgi:UDP-glucose 4-epimerase